MHTMRRSKVLLQNKVKELQKMRNGYNRKISLLEQERTDNIIARCAELEGHNFRMWVRVFCPTTYTHYSYCEHCGFKRVKTEE